MVADITPENISSLMRVGAITPCKTVYFPCNVCNQTGIVWEINKKDIPF